MTPTRVIAVRPDHFVEKPDMLATEEPMEIRVGGTGFEARTVAVTMRTPGHDFELAAGFLVSEGVVDAAHIAGIRYCGLPDDEAQLFNTVTVNLRPGAVAPDAARTHTMSSACGVCGSTSLERVANRCDVVPDGSAVPRSVIVSLVDSLRAGQKVFSRTGGLHGAGVFTFGGDLVALREDIGRHNAVDKLVGWAALDRRLPLRDHVLMASGRIGFEIVQKAAVAGIPVVAAVSAPSSLAVATATRVGIAVVGFLRDETFNVYSHPERIDLTA